MMPLTLGNKIATLGGAGWKRANSRKDCPRGAVYVAIASDGEYGESGQVDSYVPTADDFKYSTIFVIDLPKP